MPDPQLSASATPPPPPPPSAIASSSSTTSQIPLDEHGIGHPPFQSPESDVQPWHVLPNFGTLNWDFVNVSSLARDDAWSCVVVLLTFWLFVSMTMILGVYGPTTLLLSPYSSILLQPSPLFVQSMKVENLVGSVTGVMLYGTYGSPSLDVFTNWEESYEASISSFTSKEWKYYLNRGSQVNISYHLSSKSSSIYLLIIEGDDGFTQWLEDLTYPNSTLSWNVVHGTGMITQDIFLSSSYYVIARNLNEEAEVKLSIKVRASLYNTTNAYYKCALMNNPCHVNIFFPDGNAAILTSDSQQNTSRDEWHVKLSFGPRWISYILGISGMTLLMYLSFTLIEKFQQALTDRAGVHLGETATQRAPLLSHKDDDLSSWGSSYDSMSRDEEDLDFLTAGSIDGKSLVEGETSNNTRRLCAICFDAPRDCFFLPCGHCVACFECGTRIAEADGTCPVCRRKTKKVRKIFNV
ncbi:E3 ubiquitin-protein ligase APD2-like [Prosopis cineraria]|uniref:E3 ubiquitin-protein ligase APD2-like n=1 Tax=Prosopis cineraria TaxID=364024 RepID=UPI0024103C2A|nr:E3 ubiquitin-protein ligase APD2-like [Prosopis cineraria]